MGWCVEKRGSLELRNCSMVRCGGKLLFYTIALMMLLSATRGSAHPVVSLPSLSGRYDRMAAAVGLVHHGLLYQLNTLGPRLAGMLDRIVGTKGRHCKFDTIQLFH